MGICSGGEAVLEAGNTIKQSWPRFWLVFNRIESVFVSKYWWSPKKTLHQNWDCFSPDLGDLQTKKKKRSSARLKPSFLLEVTPAPWPIAIANTIRGGAIFVFRAKIGLKSAKNGVFCMLFRPMGGYSPLPLGMLLFRLVVGLPIVP